MSEYIPIIIAIISSMVAIFTTTLTVIGGFIVYKRLNVANAVGQESKNEKQKLENVDFENEVFNRLAAKLNPVLEENRDLKLSIHKLHSELDLAKFDAAKALGAEETALRQRSKLFEEVEKQRIEYSLLKSEFEEMRSKVTIHGVKLEETKQQHTADIADIKVQIEEKRIELQLEGEKQNGLNSNND